jgi:hypothetical protein
MMSVAPLQFLLLVFAGWVNRRQLEIVEYLQEENRVLREQLGDRRLRFSDAQRRGGPPGVDRARDRGDAAALLDRRPGREAGGDRRRASPGAAGALRGR